SSSWLDAHLARARLPLAPAASAVPAVLLAYDETQRQALLYPRLARARPPPQCLGEGRVRPRLVVPVRSVEHDLVRVALGLLHLASALLADRHQPHLTQAPALAPDVHRDLRHRHEPRLHHAELDHVVPLWLPERCPDRGRVLDC